jgi:uncharacterized membrane protein
MQNLSHYDYPLTRFLIAAITGVILWFVLGNFPLERRFLWSWDVSALVLLILAWLVIIPSDQSETKHNAMRQDGNRTLVGSLVILSSAVALVTVGFTLPHVQKGGSSDIALLCVLAVLEAWTLLHTTYTFHYAHLYYARAKGEGLSFYHQESPDYLDFAYFAFTLGMTYQVSDTQPTKRMMGRSIFGHSLISYVFGTGIVAVAINLLASTL